MSEQYRGGIDPEDPITKKLLRIQGEIQITRSMLDAHREQFAERYEIPQAERERPDVQRLLAATDAIDKLVQALGRADAEETHEGNERIPTRKPLANALDMAYGVHPHYRGAEDFAQATLELLGYEFATPEEQHGKREYITNLLNRGLPEGLKVVREDKQAESK